MVSRLLVAVAVSIGAVLPVAADEGLDRAVAIERAAERMAALPLWPGFAPLSIPVAVYVGERTFLFRHPAPSTDFRRVEHDGLAVWVMAGRHPGVTANSSADVAGTITATLLADGESASTSAPEALAAVAMHESFHVFQRRTHKSWQGNEGDAFLYPADDARLLALRRVESLALDRAAHAASDAARRAGPPAPSRPAPSASQA